MSRTATIFALRAAAVARAGRAPALLHRCHRGSLRREPCAISSSFSSSPPHATASKAPTSDSGASTVSGSGSASSAGSGSGFDARRAPLPRSPVVYFLLGTATGATGSLLGIAGGIVMIPVLASPLFAMPQAVAVGTAVLANASTCIAGAAVFASKGLVLVPVAATLAAAATVGSRFGAKHSRVVADRHLRMLSGVAVLALAPLVLWRARTAAGAEAAAAGAEAAADANANANAGAAAAAVAAEATEAAEANAAAAGGRAGTGEGKMGQGTNVASTASGTATVAAASAAHSHHGHDRGFHDMAAFDIMSPATCVAVGLSVGYASGLLGIGAGLLCTSALTLAVSDSGVAATTQTSSLSSSSSSPPSPSSSSSSTSPPLPAPAPFPPVPHSAVLGTSLAAFVIPHLVAGATHWQAGNIQARALPPLVAGTLAGGWAGGALAIDTDERTLKTAFAAVLMAVGVQTLWAARRAR